MASNDTRYFVFDIESVADGELVSRLKYPGEDLGPAEAIAKYRAELMALVQRWLPATRRSAAA